MADGQDVEVIEIGVGHHVELVHEDPDPLEGAVVVSVIPTGGDPRPPATTKLDDLDDVDAPPGDVGVLTREAPGGTARFEPLPVPVLPTRHTQTAAAQRWQHVHNLGYRPHYDVRDTEGRLHIPENVEHPVPGVVSEIVFGMPMVGTADPT